jgi:hypothetical protein
MTDNEETKEQVNQEFIQRLILEETSKFLQEKKEEIVKRAHARLRAMEKKD